MDQKKILVVDDDPVTLRLLENMLGREGYSVFSAADGVTGIELARRHNPDLIFMDIVLPDLDGPDTMTAIMKSTAAKDMPFVIFVSALISAEQDKLLSIKVGNKDYPAVTKPFSSQTILAVVRAELDKR